MNLVTKNVRTSLKYTAVGILSAFIFMGCSVESDAKRGALSLYQGEPTTADKTLAETGISADGKTAKFDVLLRSTLDLSAPDEELGFTFTFSFTDKELIQPKENTKISLSLYNGELSEQLIPWVEVENTEKRTKGTDGKSDKKLPAAFTFTIKVQNQKNITSIKKHIKTMNMVISIDDIDDEPSVDTLFKTVDFSDLCKDHPYNFFETANKLGGCGSLQD